MTWSWGFLKSEHTLYVRGVYSESPLHTDTVARPLGVRINRGPCNVTAQSESREPSTLDCQPASIGSFQGNFFKSFPRIRLEWEKKIAVPCLDANILPEK